jgi:hypothetical protein
MSNRNWNKGSEGLDHQGKPWEQSHDRLENQNRLAHHSSGDEGWHEDHRSHHCGHDGNHLLDSRDGSSFNPHGQTMPAEHGTSVGQVNEAPMAHQAGADLGWGDAAWGDAGGFEAVLIGHLNGIFSGAGFPEINYNTLVQNTLVDSSSVLFNTGNGGSIDVGGNVNALSSQMLDNLFHPTGDGNLNGGESGFGNSANGTGGFETAQLGGGMPSSGADPIVIVPIEHLDINFNTITQNTLVDNTQVVFNAANGGNIDVGGNVNALGSQQALLDHSSTPPDVQHLV